MSELTYYSQVFDKTSSFDITSLVDLNSGSEICISLDARWYNLFSGLLDVFRSDKYLRGTEQDILEFQQQIAVVQEIIALAIECGGASMTCQDVELCLQTSQIISDIQSNITALQSADTVIQGDITTIQGDITTIQGDITTIQGDITTIQNQLATINPSKVLPIVQTYHLGSYNPTILAQSVVVPILQGFDNVIIKVFGGNTGTSDTSLEFYINGDTNTSNYVRGRTGERDGTNDNGLGSLPAYTNVYNAKVLELRIDNYSKPSRTTIYSQVFYNATTLNDAPESDVNIHQYNQLVNVISVELLVGATWDENTVIDVFYEKSQDVLVPTSVPDLPIPLPLNSIPSPTKIIDFSEQLPSQNYFPVIGTRVLVNGNPDECQENSWNNSSNLFVTTDVFIDDTLELTGFAFDIYLECGFASIDYDPFVRFDLYDASNNLIFQDTSGGIALYKILSEWYRFYVSVDLGLQPAKIRIFNELRNYTTASAFQLIRVDNIEIYQE